MSASTVPQATVPRQSPEKTACIYARVSTTDQADKGYSLPTQIEACLALAQRHSYIIPPGIEFWMEVVRCLSERQDYAIPQGYVYVDDYTGTSLNRPRLTKLRDVVRNGLVQAVITYDLDRLSRRMAHQLLLTDELEAAGVAIHVVTMPATDKSPETQLLSNVRGIIAEYDRAKILERTMRGLMGRAKAGYPPAGVIPLGYRYVKHDGKGGHYDIVSEEAALIQDIFRWYAQDGLSMHAIAVRLIHARVPTPWTGEGKAHNAHTLWVGGTSSVCGTFSPMRRISAPCTTAKSNACPAKTTPTKRPAGVMSPARNGFLSPCHRLLCRNCFRQHRHRSSETRRVLQPPLPGLRIPGVR